MPLLTREDLLKKEKLQIVKIDLGNGEFVYVKQMTAKERDRFENSILKPVKNKEGEVIDYQRSLEDFRAKLAVFSICDKDGNLILKSTDYMTLSENISAAKLEKIVNVIQKINVMTEDDRENLLKSSVSGRKDNSTSASQKS